MNFRFFPFVIVCVLYVSCANNLPAQSWSGAGGDGLWSNGANWSGGSPPVNGSTAVNFQAGGGAVQQDLGTFIFGAGSSDIFRLSGPAYQFSGDAIQFEPNSQIRVSGANHTFSNDWILSGRTLLMQSGTSSGTNEDFFLNGTISGAGELEVQHLLTIGGDFSAAGDLYVRGGSLGGKLTVDGIVSSSTGLLRLSSSELTGSGVVNKDIDGGLAIIRSTSGGPKLTLNGDISLIGGTTSTNRNFIQRLVESNGSLTFQDDSRSVISTAAVLSGTGDIGINADAIVINQGTIGSGHLLSVGAGAGIQGAGGVVNGDVISNGGFVRENTFNGLVTQNDGAMTEGVFNGAVTINGGAIGIFGNQQTTTFNNVVQIAGNANARATLITGVGTLDIDAVLTFDSNVDFSDTINWDISGSTAGDLGTGTAGSFLGNNVALTSGQLNGSSTNYVVAGNLISNGASTLNQSVTVNGDTTIATGTLTVATGRTLAATNLVLQNSGQIANNGTLAIENMVLESATINGNVNLTDSFIVRTSGTSQVASGSAIDIVGATTIEQGTLLVNAGSSLTGTGSVTIENSGTIDLQGVISKDVLIAIGGLLQGSGDIEGNLTIAGAIGPGNSAGTLGIDGTLDADEIAMICIEIGGTTAGENGYDTIDGRGSSLAMLDGDLEVSLIDGFAPSAGDDFFVLNNFASITGTFRNTTGGVLQFDGGEFRVEYASSSVRLFQYQVNSVPEPSSAFLFFALLTCGCHRRKRPPELSVRRS